MTTRSLLHYDPSGEFTLPALQGWSIKAVDDALAAQKLANQQCYVVGICSINAASALPPIEELVADTPSNGSLSFRLPASQTAIPIA